MTYSKISLKSREDYPNPTHFRFAQFMDKAALTFITGLRGKEDPSIPAGWATIRFYTKEDAYDFVEFLNGMRVKTKVIKRNGVRVRAKKQSVLWQLRKDIMKTASSIEFEDGYRIVFWYPDSNDVNDMRTRINWIMKGFR